MILLSFLVLATVETQIGKHNHAYHAAASVLQAKFGISLDVSLWLIMAAKMALMLGGMFLVTTAIYFIGSLVGRANSRRVLFRRLAVVFTVILGGFTVSHFAAATPALAYVAYALYAWGVLLGYVAIKEQFETTHLSTAIVAVCAFLMVTSTWHFSNAYFENSVRNRVESLAKKPAAPHGQKSRADF